MLRQSLIAAASLLALAACSNPPETKGAASPSEQAATPDANPAATVPTPADEAAAPDFASLAAASDMFEIEASKLALQRSNNAEVKAFAQMMIDAHTKTSEALKAAITASGATVNLPATLPQNLQEAMDKLRSASNEDFDAAYMNAQVDRHQAALDLFQRYAQDGDIAALKTLAAATAPAIQQHLDKARALRDKVD
ncbi:MAG: DUF4142 domain-containing protein [Caulobacteraceae bacterium]